jgi:ComF family protein
LFSFEGALRRAMHQLKYQGEIGLGDSLAALMIPFVEKLDWEVELLVPVPLGKKRKEERGYNQVGLLARPLSLAMGWKYRPRALSRTRETRSQVGLSAEERRENMRDAFTARVKSVQGRRVLVMDDVATTGATLDSCARALLEAGAREVYALTLARALPHHGLTVA